MGTHPHFLWTDLFKNHNSDQKTMAHVLKENIIFSTLTPRELTYLNSLVYERIYQPNEFVFQQNDKGLGMYVISQGRVAIQPRSSGTETLEIILKEGSFFGEIALVDRESPRNASAIALERTVLIGFFISDLSEIVERRPSMGTKILIQLSTVLARRLQETAQKITRLTEAS